MGAVIFKRLARKIKPILKQYSVSCKIFCQFRLKQLEGNIDIFIFSYSLDGETLVALENPVRKLQIWTKWLRKA